MPTIDLSKYKGATRQTTSIVPMRIKTKSSLLNREISLPWSKKIDAKIKESFYLESGSLLSSGVDLKMALDIFTQGLTKQVVKGLFVILQESVVQGKSLSDAMAGQADFTEYEIQSVKIGEETGRLGTILNQLGSYYQERLKQKKKLTSAMIYPLMVLATSMGAIVFMLQFVVPMFADVFVRFGGKLPWLTQMVVSVSNLFKDSFFYVLLLLVGLSVTIYSFRNNITFKRGATSLLLRIPVIGPMVRLNYLARFCSSLSLLSESSVPLLRAMELIRKMIRFYPLQKALEEIEDDLMHGLSLYESLKKYSFFPLKLLQLIKVGEEINSLDHFSKQLAESYAEELNYKTQNISAMMEPFIIIFLGLMVGVILVAMYLPMFQMGNQL